MWALLEPLHGVTYFSPEARAAYEAIGVRGSWRSYFAGRSAPLGAVGPEPVVSAFYNFAPAMVVRALPAVWEVAAPEQVLAARLHGAVDALRRVRAEAGEKAGEELPEARLAAAADVLDRVLDGLDCGGRPLGSAHASLPRPLDPLGRIWHAATVLREHRGDGHVAALVAAGISGVEALVLRCGVDLRRDEVQPARGWTDEEWAAAADRLAARGWLSPDGAGGGVATSAGQQVRDEVEDATERAATRAWEAVSVGEIEQVEAALGPLSRAARGVLPESIARGLPR